MLYYLLLLGEYTQHRAKDKRRTKKFRANDIALWHNNQQLDPYLSKDFLKAHCMAAPLSIFNQKYWCRAQTIHQEAIYQWHFPVKAVIYRLKHTMWHTNNQGTIIWTFFTAAYPQEQCITAAKFNKAVKQTVSKLNVNQQGLLPQHVGSHNLRVGGVMAIYLNKVDHNTFKNEQIVLSHFPDIHSWTNSSVLIWHLNPEVKYNCISKHYISTNQGVTTQTNSIVNI